MKAVKFAMSVVFVPILLPTAAVALPGRAVPVHQASDPESFLPPAYDSKFAYPVVVLLPPLGATADDVFRGFLAEDWAHTSRQASFESWLSRMPLNKGDDVARRGFILLLVGGKGTLDHGFDATIHQAEIDVARALDWLRNRHSFDSRRILLAGFSLGGDVSFAMVLRNPGGFAGAVIMSSGMNYGGQKYFERLQSRQIRMYLSMGALDPRLAGMKRSRKLLDQNGVKTEMTIIEGYRHQQPPGTEFLRAVRFVLAPDSK